MLDHSLAASRVNPVVRDNIPMAQHLDNGRPNISRKGRGKCHQMVHQRRDLELELGIQVSTPVTGQQTLKCTAILQPAFTLAHRVNPSMPAIRKAQRNSSSAPAWMTRMISTTTKILRHNRAVALLSPRSCRSFSLP